MNQSSNEPEFEWTRVRMIQSSNDPEFEWTRVRMILSSYEPEFEWTRVQMNKSSTGKFEIDQLKLQFCTKYAARQGV